MSKLKTNQVTFGVLAVLSVVVFLAAGCSKSPLGSVEDTSQPQLLQRTVDKDFAAQMSSADLYTEAVISSDEGGQLTLFDVILDIPAGAVENDTIFSINIPDINVFYNEFGTDGLVFAKPVTVTMSYRDANLSGIDETTIRIGWYNETTGSYNDIVCDIDCVNKVVTGEVNHFSAYALISD